MTHLPNPNLARIRQTHPKTHWDNIRKKEQEHRQQIGKPVLRGIYTCCICGQSTTKTIENIYICQACIERHSVAHMNRIISKLR